MNLSEKIQLLRKCNGYSQEELASVCNVSRQSVSKWEADISLPETDKLIILSNLFQVTVDVLDYIHVHKVELWNTGGVPKYWTVIFFTSDVPNFPELVSKILIADVRRGGNWFVDFKCGNIKYIVFKGKILKYKIGNINEKTSVCEECRKLGISDREMNWKE